MSTPAHAHSSSAWDNHAQKWESSIQSVTLAPCTALLSHADSALSFSTRDAKVLDNGAGAGMLTSLLKTRNPGLAVTATDLSSGMLDTVKRKAAKEGWCNVETQVMDAQDLHGLPNDAFSHVMCTFVTNFTANPRKAVQEMYRVTRPGGVVGLAPWSRVSWIPLWEKAVREFKPCYRAPAPFHPETMEVDGVRKELVDSGYTVSYIDTYKCYEEELSSAAATDKFYNMGNPTIHLLTKDFDNDFLEKTKPVFQEEYEKVYTRPGKRQFTLAILAVATK